MMMTPMCNLDRLAPTRRPAARAVMHQQWQHLLFLHWRVPVNVLRPLVPQGLEIDTFGGHAYVGLVPFTMKRVRPLWTPAIPHFSDFHEINVRTYVHNSREPGVWFFSLDAANPLAVMIARQFWKLPYYYSKMRLQERENGEIFYETHRLFPKRVPASASIHYTPTGKPTAAQPGTLEHFLVERYTLYSYSRNKLYQGRVYHAPYQIQAAELHDLKENLVAAAGILHADDLPLIHYSSQVDVEIFALRPT